MKRLIIIAKLLTLAECMPKTSDKDARERAIEPTLYTDRITGCDYLTTSDAKALTPRIATDGKTHMGCKGARP